MPPRLAILSAMLLVAGAVSSQSTTIAPNDPGIVWSGVMAASIDATRASFSRPGTSAICCADLSPGVRASFCTDATTVEVTVDYVWITMLPDFSVEIDGVTQPKFGRNAPGQGTFVVMSQPTSVPRVVTIVWPIAADVDLLSIRLTGGSPQLLPCVSPASRQRVVCFGDSIVQGAFVSEPNRSLPAELTRAYGWDVINAGYFGHHTVGGDGAAIGALAPTMVVLAIGTNDFGYQTPLVTFAAEYDQWIAAFRASPGCAEVPIVCVTPTTRSDEMLLPNVLEDYRDYLRFVVSVRALGDPNLHLLEGWDMVSPGSLTDGVHLTDAGFGSYARALGALNLVRNPGFEIARVGLPAHLWEDLGNTSVSRTTVLTGRQSLRVDLGGGRRQRIVGLGAGDCYHLSAKAVVEGPADVGRITIQFLDASDVVVGSSEASVTSTSWQSVDLSGVAPAGAVQARLVLDKPAGLGAMFVDDLNLPLCLPARSTELRGCYGSNPPGSLLLLGGRPALGVNLTFGFDNPLATQSMAIPFLFASLDAGAAFPCGTQSASLGLAGPGAGGEMLLGSLVLGPWVGSAWSQGTASPISLPVPVDYALVGTSIYLQGAMCDEAFCGLTNAIEVVIGN